MAADFGPGGWLDLTDPDWVNRDPLRMWGTWQTERQFDIGQKEIVLTRDEGQRIMAALRAETEKEG